MKDLNFDMPSLIERKLQGFVCGQTIQGQKMVSQQHSLNGNGRPCRWTKLDLESIIQPSINGGPKNSIFISKGFVQEWLNFVSILGQLVQSRAIL